MKKKGRKTKRKPPRQKKNRKQLKDMIAALQRQQHKKPEREVKRAEREINRDNRSEEHREYYGGAKRLRLCLPRVGKNHNRYDTLGAEIVWN